MKSVMSHKFSQIPQAEIPRSSFDRSHGVKTTFDSGKLIPFFIDEALPGDTFNLRTSGFARLSTPIYPIMDNMYMDTFYFAVPLRLVWDNFQKMMGEQTDPGDSVDYTVPNVDCPPGGYTESSIFDYFGIPTGVDLDATTSEGRPSALPFRAMNLIWNEWFRDQNLQDSVIVKKDDSNDSYLTAYNNGAPLTRGKRHDYFTSCLPWPQKGVAVELPLGSTAPIVSVANSNPLVRSSANNTFNSTAADLRTEALTGRLELNQAGYGEVYIDPNGSLQADLSSATASTINQLRQAFQIQKMYERDARGGTRYTEIIKSHFGVTSPDSRLQRPEYLGGGSSPVNITPIAQTSESGTSPQGNLAAMGTASFQGHGFTKSFTEHTIIIGLVNVRADLTYQQGLNKMWSRKDKLDFYWPALAHIGEQAVLNREIYAQGTSADDDVFGYQERFAEYRYKPSTIHGAFRSNAATLLMLGISQDFASTPLLNSTFIEDNPPIDRVVAVPSEPQFIADFYHKLICARPMPMNGTPGMIDHF